MSKKTSGLGRGLGDLLEDNAPSVRVSGTVIRRDEDGEVSVSPERISEAEIISSFSGEAEQSNAKAEDKIALTETGDAPHVIVATGAETVEGGATAENPSETEAAEATEGGQAAEEGQGMPLFEEAPRTRSLKALFREYK